MVTFERNGLLEHNTFLMDFSESYIYKCRKKGKIIRHIAKIILSLSAIYIDKRKIFGDNIRSGNGFESLEGKRVNIIIVGSGKVGYTLAQHLNAEGHEITVIDSDEEKIKDLSSEMDIYCVLGNGTSYRTKKKQALKKQTF